ncbi:hypothetical protein TIFTF001_046428 [Ficus carica]|uniref:Disease resistance RPP13-like protein 1 n=1 Tax=Ficus carica TaxID=3494 RepID=A0AA87Z8E4_FICCA|nr:hypothetical protein TIFTF001_046428 [Ficus carica]
MVELVAGALLSSLFQTLFDKLASRELRSFFRGLKVNQELLRKLKIMLLSANQLLDDVEEKQLASSNVREWLFELKNTIYEAIDVLDEINYRALRYEQKRSKPSSKMFQSFLNCFSTFDEATKRKIVNILDRLKFIIEQKDVLGLKHRGTSRLSQRLLAPLADESCVYGMSDDKEKVIELLVSDSGSSSNKISVIPITGMGGIGKTTFAQLVYEESIVKSQFLIRSWVTVSNGYTFSITAKRIMDEVISHECKIEDPNQFQHALKEALSDRRFLLVLNDVWDESYAHLEPLMSCFQSGACGSRIIVTTSSDTIAEKMGTVPTHYLQTVSDDACLMIFENLVFKDARFETNQEIHAIGRDIVRKCKGVPLVVKSLDGLLRSVPDLEEWKRILNNDLWELQLKGEKRNNILPYLWLSYHYLPSHLKRSLLQIWDSTTVHQRPFS